MNHPVRSFSAAVLVAALAFIFTTGTANAHSTLPWNGCANTTVCNTTLCTVTLQLTYNQTVIFTLTLGPSQCLIVPTSIANISHVLSAGGNRYTVVPPPPAPPCNCLANEWSTACVTLPPSNCCCDVCFDPATCTITIKPAACIPPGPCRL